MTEHNITFKMCIFVMDSRQRNIIICIIYNSLYLDYHNSMKCVFYNIIGLWHCHVTISGTIYSGWTTLLFPTLLLYHTHANIDLYCNSVFHDFIESWHCHLIFIASLGCDIAMWLLLVLYLDWLWLYYIFPPLHQDPTTV